MIQIEPITFDCTMIRVFSQGNDMRELPGANYTTTIAPDFPKGGR